MRGVVLTLALFGATACSETSTTVAPTPTPAPAPTPTPTPAPTTYTLSGTLTATNGGQPLRGATLDVAGVSAMTDGSGRYTLDLPLNTPSPSFAISGAGLVTHTGFLRNGGSRNLDLDAIQTGGLFSLEFYRQLVRGTLLTSPESSLMRWTANPNIYIRTKDTGGRDVEPEVLALVADWVDRSIPLWTNGSLRRGTLETGAPDRPGTRGWMVVEFVREMSADYCGRSPVGTNPGRVTLNDDRCNCGSVKVPAGVMLHEMGHALGFGHVSDRGSVMYRQLPGGCPTPALSALEQHHAAIAYRRPVGNTDPDDDPASAPQ